VSSITTDQGILHYEVYGRGRPVILLHGWLGSWGLWQETMAYLGQYYRTYALDFWGFGESGRKLNTYKVDDFIKMVDQFMEQMGIVSAPLVGHSMGGTVSLSVAMRYPERAQKVVVIGSPIKGESLALALKFAGYRPIAFLLFRLFPLFRFAMRIAAPFICRDPRFSDMMDHDLTSLTLESFLISIATLRRTDLRPDLHKIKIPVMGMYGDRDNIVSPNEWKTLKDGVGHAQIERFSKAGHFIMMDEGQECMSKIKGFLDTPIPLPENPNTPES
jgi:pimeloyl-ACP methyl ester carboxylesterase